MLNYNQDSIVFLWVARIGMARKEEEAFCVNPIKWYWISRPREVSNIVYWKHSSSIEASVVESGSRKWKLGCIYSWSVSDAENQDSRTAIKNPASFKVNLSPGTLTAQQANGESCAMLRKGRCHEWCASIGTLGLGSAQGFEIALCHRLLRRE